MMEMICIICFGQVPLYVGAQLAGSLLASLTLRLMFKVTPEAYFGTTPTDSAARALVAEIIISFLLMFVISGVSTDSRAVSFFLYVSSYLISFSYPTYLRDYDTINHESMQMEVFMLLDGYQYFRQIGELAGIAVGMTIMLNVFVAG